jgi:transcriptional regulator with XRE-family HTH domain
MKQTLHEVVGERIRTLRRRRHWTQPDLAAKAKIGMTTLNRLENGHHSMSIDKLVALVKTLETSADYILGLSGEPREG